MTHVCSGLYHWCPKTTVPRRYALCLNGNAGLCPGSPLREEIGLHGSLRRSLPRMICPMLYVFSGPLRSTAFFSGHHRSLQDITARIRRALGGPDAHLIRAYRWENDTCQSCYLPLNNFLEVFFCFDVFLGQFSWFYLNLKSVCLSCTRFLLILIPHWCHWYAC